MLFDRSLSTFSVTSFKQHMEYFNFQCKIVWPSCTDRGGEGEGLKRPTHLSVALKASWENSSGSTNLQLLPTYIFKRIWFPKDLSLTETQFSCKTDKASRISSMKSCVTKALDWVIGAMLDRAGLGCWFHCSGFVCKLCENSWKCRRCNKQRQPNPVLLSMVIADNFLI